MHDPISQEFDAELSPDARQLIDSGRAFSQAVVAPAAAAWERERRFPLAALKQACAAGLIGIELPREQGGLGLTFGAKLRLVEEIARDDFGFAFALVNHNNAIERVGRAQAGVAARLLPGMLAGDLIGCAAYTEPEHGSDLAQLTTSAVRTGNGWILNGAKSWTTNAAVASVFLTLAQTELGSGARGIASFLVEADRAQLAPAGFERLPTFELQGAHAIGAGGLRLRDYQLPDECLLDPPGEAFKQSLAGINRARAYVAAMCAGMLDAGVRLAVGRAARRTAFGQPVIGFQGLRWSLVDAATDLAALRLLVYRAARQIDAGQDADEAAAAAKKFAGERTLSHLAVCVQALGANGLKSEVPLMRHLVAAKTACFTDGTTEMMNERLGKLLVRRWGAT